LDETWIYRYDLQTKQQSMEWRQRTSLCPKNSEYRNPLDKLSNRLFGMKMASSSLIISKGPNYQRRVLLISFGAIEGYFEGNTQREVHQFGLVLARQHSG